MTSPRPRGFVAFLREAKRRKVYVSAVAYVGVSVVIIELTGAVSEALLFPDWTYRLVTFLLILGLPVVLILSWTFDITGHGVVRTSEADEEKVKDGGGSGSRALGGSAGGGGAGSRGESSARPTLRAPRVAMPALKKRRGARTEAEAPGTDGEVQAPDPERVRRATIAHMRHELRTPINGIIGYSEMLLEDVEEEDYTRDLERIRAGGQKLLVLIDEVLGESAVGARDKELESYAEQIQVDLRTPVTSVVGYAEMLLETAQEKGRDELVPDLERIHTSAHRLLELSGDIVGLATSSEGASPLDGSEASELTRTVLSKIQPSRSEGAGDAEGRLLVVDDNAMNRDLLSRQLARQGYIVLTASDGAEALELLRSQSVDLILLDVIMPTMDGVETLKRLKSDPSLEEIPVLMLSSLDEVDGALRCIELGAEDYLSKPVKPAVLEARITANLELFRMRARERAFQERLEADDAFIQGLLLSAFPQGVAERVRAGEREVADVVPEATVLFCSLRGMSTPTSSGSLSRRLQEFREICTAIEGLLEDHGVETCIWRADGFMAVAGAPSPQEDHVERATGLARDLLARGSTLPGPDGQPLRMGMGIHTGPVVAAALGGEKLRYEVWGEGVKMAEAVAATAPDGAVLASPPVYSRMKESLTFQPQKVRDIGGIQMRTYLLGNGAPE